MVRTRFEVLEKRQMFAASSLSDAVEAYVLMNCPNDFMDSTPEAIAGDFNGDGADELARITGRQGFILPYIEQDNLYKAQAGDDSQVGCAAVFVAEITDGTSNTIMFRGASGNDAMATRSLVDTWEHAYSRQPGATANGIIAILIGLAADPSDPSGNTVCGSGLLVDPCPPPPRRYDGTADRASALGSVGEAALGANFCLCDGSVRFLRVDTTGMADLPSALDASSESESGLLLASDEYFAQFSNTTLDDAPARSVLLGRGDGTFAVTHDAEFEDWARVSRFDRGYLSPG